MKIAIIGKGAISGFVCSLLKEHNITPAAFLVRAGKEGYDQSGIACVSASSELPPDIDLIVDCAGHSGLTQHGVPALKSGIDVITVSVGALASTELESALVAAARGGNSRLELISGAIGGLDALRAAKCANLTAVTYVGRKPPLGWIGSPADEQLDLANLQTATTHFQGTAREAALNYPKNANVAAAVALSSLGFDKTTVQLIADPNVETNIHEIVAQGDFGEMHLIISGNSLPDNPKSSMLAALSVVAAILKRRESIGF